MTTIILALREVLLGWQLADLDERLRVYETLPPGERELAFDDFWLSKLTYDRLREKLESLA